LNGDLYGVTIRDVAAGYYHNLALSTTGEVFAWGGNGNVRHEYLILTV
jgi:alpha-tubulin suppressor-like RCC1 family protein